MIRHKNCVSDPLTKEWWRDFQHVMKSGNPLGMSFTEYVAQRVALQTPRTYTTTSSQLPWYVAECGHQHPWGLPCSVWTSVT